MKNQKPKLSQRKITSKRTNRRVMPFYKRMVLHPLSLFLVLCCGVLLLASGLPGSASSSKLTMKISAPLPPSAAYITEPADQSRFSVRDINVSGTCPQDSYVKIYNNDIFKGTAICTSTGTFEVALQLIAGENELKARVFNTTDDEGPASPAVTVFYVVPASPAPSPKPTPPRGSIPPRTTQPEPKVPTTRFQISADYKYRVYESGQGVKLELKIIGGAAPFALAVSWGDGQITPVLRQNRDSFQIEHTYAGINENQTYIIKVAGIDAKGVTDFLHMTAIVNGQDMPIGTTSQPPTNYLLSTINRYLKYFGPAYIIFLLMVISFWLGEREEWHKIMKRRTNLSHR